MIADPSSLLAARLAEFDARLEHLEKQIEEIGIPAGQNLRERLASLKIQERALKRNLDESHAAGEPDSARLEKINALFHHIVREESLMEENANFLTQAAPSSVTIIAQAAAKTLEVWQRALHKVVGDHHPLGASTFVNHTHEDIVAGRVPDKDNLRS